MQDAPGRSITSARRPPMINLDDRKSSPPRTVDATALAAVLEPFLGPHTARNAIRTFSRRALGRVAERFEREEAELVLAALLPMLRTLLGTAAADLMTLLRESLP
jgi:hypothetical protein